MKSVTLNRVYTVNSVFEKLGIISFKLKELNNSHFKNRDYILRILANNQDITSLYPIANISKPLKPTLESKEYIRYKSFSPFVIFSNVCLQNPPDAMEFNKLVIESISKETLRGNKKAIISFFEKWMYGYERFIKLKLNFNLDQIKPQYKNLYIVAKHFKKLLKLGKLEDIELLEMNICLTNLNTPFAHAEIEVAKSLEQLKNFVDYKNNKI